MLSLLNCLRSLWAFWSWNGARSFQKPCIGWIFGECWYVHVFRSTWFLPDVGFLICGVAVQGTETEKTYHRMKKSLDQCHGNFVPSKLMLQLSFPKSFVQYFTVYVKGIRCDFFIVSCIDPYYAGRESRCFPNWPWLLAPEEAKTCHYQNLEVTGWKGLQEVNRFKLLLKPGLHFSALEAD